MPPPTWSKEPPTVAGWYRFRRPGADTEVVNLNHEHYAFPVVLWAGCEEETRLKDMRGEWWPIPIQPPETP